MEVKGTRRWGNKAMKTNGVKMGPPETRTVEEKERMGDNQRPDETEVHRHTRSDPDNNTTMNTT